MSQQDTVRNFKDLTVWQKSMTLANVVYSAAREFPKEERYGLTSQIQRCAVSVPSNIAEGNSRIHRGDYVRHLSIARGSLAELETQLMLARDFEYMTNDQLAKVVGLCNEVGKMLTTIINKLRN